MLRAFFTYRGLTLEGGVRILFRSYVIFISCIRKEVPQ